MADEPILFVAGFGRCGTTMVMTMLDRGGFPVSGPRPGYEAEAMMLGRVDIDWVRAQAGRAVKWIDPLNAKISAADLGRPAVILHLDRSKREMAASQVKMVAAFTGVANDRTTRRAFERDLIKSDPAMLKVLGSLGVVYSFIFEWVLQEPFDAAGKLRAIVEHEFGSDFDVAAAGAVPLKRSARCAPDLSLEIGLIEATGGIR